MKVLMHSPIVTSLMRINLKALTLVHQATLIAKKSQKAITIGDAKAVVLKDRKRKWLSLLTI